MSDQPHFFFGTLRDREVLELVLGRTLDAETCVPAWLPGFRVARVVEENYPTLIADEGAEVPGTLVYGLGDTDIERIGWFEGTEYEARTLPVRTARGAVVEARVQTANERLALDDRAWDFARWQRDEKARLLTLTRAHMALMGKVDAEEAARRWDALREALDRGEGEGT